ncbi:MAG: hypothetical protein CMJ46_01145 [Planctomyces sp.]|nr:hypothetical protein [Planctomyces sp.]
MRQEMKETIERENQISLSEMSEDIVSEAAELLTEPWLTETIIANAANLGIAGERKLILTIYLVGTSRMLEKPLAAIVQGPSSSGKSHLIEKVGKLFPPETVIHATQMTPQALYYMLPGELSHRFVIAGERSLASDSGQVEATRALREMLSAGYLSKLTPVKTAEGVMETQRIEQRGPIAYVESTTSSNVFDEDANRCVMLQTDERPEQTLKILKSIADNHNSRTSSDDRDRIISVHHAIQRLLAPYEISIPFASQLTEMIPSDRVEMRRAFPQLLGMIQASCLLHQKQRSIDESGRLQATQEDYQIARTLLQEPMTRSFGRGYSEGAVRCYERLQVSFGFEEFTTLEASRKDKFSRRAVTGWLKELETAGMVNQVEVGRGRTPSKWQLVRQELEADELFAENSILPSVSAVFGANEDQAELAA